jgi:hypothetical protein
MESPESLIGSGIAIGLSAIFTLFKSRKDKGKTEKQTQEMINKDRLLRIKEQDKQERYKDELGHRIGNELTDLKSLMYESGLELITNTTDEKIKVVLKHYQLNMPKDKVFAPFHDALKAGFKVCKDELKRTLLYEDLENQSIDQLRSRISDLAVTIQHLYCTTIRKQCGKADIYEQAMDSLTILSVFRSMEKLSVFRSMEKLYRFVLREQNKKTYNEWEGSYPMPSSVDIVSRINAKRMSEAAESEKMDDSNNSTGEGV